MTTATGVTQRTLNCQLDESLYALGQVFRAPDLKRLLLNEGLELGGGVYILSRSKIR